MFFVPECVARVPVSLWGSGGKAVFAKSCVCVRNRPQVFATVCVSAVRLSTVASASGVVPKACKVDSWRHSYIGVCRGGVSVSDLCRGSFVGVCRGGVCVSDGRRRSYCIFVFAEEVSAWAICVAAVTQECLTRVSRKSVWQECQVRVPQKSVKKERHVKVSYRSVKQECLTRVSSKSVLQECQVRVFYKSVK